MLPSAANSGPVTVPLPEYSNVSVSYSVGIGESWVSVAGAFSVNLGKVKLWMRTL